MEALFGLDGGRRKGPAECLRVGVGILVSGEEIEERLDLRGEGSGTLPGTKDEGGERGSCAPPGAAPVLARVRVKQGVGILDRRLRKGALGW